MYTNKANLYQEPLPKPSQISTIAVITIVSGVINVLYGLGLTATVVLGTLGVGILCAPVTLLPSILGVFEIIYGSKLSAVEPTVDRPSQALAIMQILMIGFGNIISLVIGILALVFYQDPGVQQYFEQLRQRRLPG